MTAKTAAQRMAAFRADRKVTGFARLELYVHPEDWPIIKELAKQLNKNRAKSALVGGS